MKILVSCLLVGVGGFLGALARYGVSALSGSKSSFPIGTMIVNLTGCLALGWIMAARQREALSNSTQLLLATGFVGAYTTFSTFMYESSSLFKNGSTEAALFNIVFSIVMGLLAVRAGMWVGGR